MLTAIAVTVMRAGRRRVVTRIEGRLENARERHGGKADAIGRERDGGQRRSVLVESPMLEDRAEDRVRDRDECRSEGQA